MGRPSSKVVAVLVVTGLVVLVGAGAIGWAIGNSSNSSSEAEAETPAGHSGAANLAVAEIGDPAAGRMLIVEKGCTDCHSYGGEGGEDAPPLDFMKGHLSATEVANMSGRIWNHLPAMLDHFDDEGLPVPTFEDDEMANLIAYLHSGEGGPPDVPDTGMMDRDETGEETTTGG